MQLADLLLSSLYTASLNLKVKVLDFVKSGGAEGIRTPDPLLAKQVLSQLSYSPTDPTNSFRS